MCIYPLFFKDSNTCSKFNHKLSTFTPYTFADASIISPAFAKFIINVSSSKSALKSKSLYRSKNCNLKKKKELLKLIDNNFTKKYY